MSITVLLLVVIGLLALCLLSGMRIALALALSGFVGFYLLAGVIGSLAQILIDPTSIIPTLGASGAISGVLGAYLVPTWLGLLGVAVVATFCLPLIVVIVRDPTRRTSR